ncbi:MAG: helix-turn-helix transcriptional regulator [Blautia sp.]|nr:helix-turn-helix transcriptional regulator [Blautia sp.]MCM1200370.1 helix-turn-helix transcriptional regulator [Bacteroides fragilis]
MKISRDKINICMARKKMTVQALANAYGVSRARINVLLNQREVSTVSAGRMASALGVDVTEILETN